MTDRDRNLEGRVEQLESELRSAHALLRQAEQERVWRHRFELATQAAGVWTWETALVPNNAFLWDANRPAYLAHCSLADLNKEMARLTPVEDHAALRDNFYDALAQKREVHAYAFRLVLPSGAARYLQARARLVFDAAGSPVGLLGATTDITERKAAEAELENIHKQLLDASRRGGMAEIASNVLHNVGNVLNSVNVSVSVVSDSVKKSKAPGLIKAAALLREHERRGDLGAFITEDEHGRHVPGYLHQLAGHLQTEQAQCLAELEALRQNIDHIKEIVAMQQSYATMSGLKELLNPTQLVEDSLRLNAGALSRHGVEVVREFEAVPAINVDKHRVLQILVNLVRNAKYACDESGRRDKRLTVRIRSNERQMEISVIDNGVGIAPENLTRIFNHGFTTRQGGHGFGLHSGALAARELGGSLTAHSQGVGYGATFTLTLPLDCG